MTAATTARAAVATVPYALFGIADNMTAFALPTPETIDVHQGRITLWLLAKDVPAWTGHANVGPVEHEQRDAFIVHWADAVLDGCCVRVRFRWILTNVEAHADACHVECEGSDYADRGHVTLCLDDSCPDSGTVERVCGHGRDLCDQCWGRCPECRDERRPS